MAERVCGILGRVALFAATGLAALLSYSGVRADALPQFVDVAREAGVTFRHDHGGWVPITILETDESGIGFVDYDGDGDLDIYAVNGAPTRLEPRPGGAGEPPVNRLYRNNGDGTFADVTAAAGVGHAGAGLGLAVGDYDNDGNPDLYVTNWGPNVLYRNNGDGTFTDVAAAAGVGDPRWGHGSAFGDYDNDGDLDLYVANYVAYRPDGLLWCYHGPQRVRYGCSPWNYDPQPNVLYRNNGDGTFADVTAAAGVANPEGRGLSAVFGDYDGDGWVDVYISNDASPNVLYHNLRDGTFEDVTLMSGVGLSETGQVQASMGCAFGDYNNDGLPDIFITNYADETNTLYQNDGDGFFTVRSAPLGLAGPSLHSLTWGTGFYDFDNDGYRDIFTATGHVYDVVEQMHAHQTFKQRNQLFMGRGAKGFVEMTDQAGPGLQIVESSRGTAFGDYDNDGDVDILVTNSGAEANLLRNDGGNRSNWVAVQLIGGARMRADGKGWESARGPGRPFSNRDGVGALVTVTAGDLTLHEAVARGTSYLSPSDPRLHFGLGSRTQADRIEIRWPSGVVDVVANVAARQLVVIEEGAGVVKTHVFR